MTGRELIREIKRGNLSILEKLRNKYWRKFLKSIRDWNQREEDAREAYCTAIMDIYARIKNNTYDPDKAKLSTFLIHIAKKRLITKIETSVRTQKTNKHYHTLTDKGAIHINIFKDIDDKKMVSMILKSLKKEDALLLELFYLRGWCFEAIGEELGISKEAARVRRHDIIRRIQKRISDNNLNTLFFDN